jgi:hypothetical protein
MNNFVTFTMLILTNGLFLLWVVTLVGVACAITWMLCRRSIHTKRRPSFWIAIGAAASAPGILMLLNEARRLLGFEPLSPGLMVVFAAWLTIIALIATSLTLAAARKKGRAPG